MAHTPENTDLHPYGMHKLTQKLGQVVYGFNTILPAKSDQPMTPYRLIKSRFIAVASKHISFVHRDISHNYGHLPCSAEEPASHSNFYRLRQQDAKLYL